MNADKLDFHEIDDVIRNAAEKVPTGNNAAMGWEQMAKQLEEAGPQKKSNKRFFFKGFSLNMLLLLAGVLSGMAVSYSLLEGGTVLGKEKKNKENNPFDKEDLTPAITIPQQDKTEHLEEGRQDDIFLEDKSQNKNLPVNEPAQPEKNPLKEINVEKEEQPKPDSTRQEDDGIYIFW